MRVLMSLWLSQSAYIADVIQDKLTTSSLLLGISFFSLSSKVASKAHNTASSCGDSEVPLGDIIRKGFPKGKNDLGGSCGRLISMFD
jgi:hypothetical protein